MTGPLALPPIGGYILTGQLTTRRAAHAPVILRHDLTTEFFGIEEREAGWPDFHGFNVFPISTAALDLLRAMLAEDDRHEIDTGHSAFGWIPRPKVSAAQLMGLPVSQPALFATAKEAAAHRTAQPVPTMPQPPRMQLDAAEAALPTSRSGSSPSR